MGDDVSQQVQLHVDAKHSNRLSTRVAAGCQSPIRKTTRTEP